MTDVDPIWAVREWVGSLPEDGDIEDALVRHDDDAKRAALAILRVRRADLVASAAKWAVDGDYSQDATANIKALDAVIGRLENDLGVDETANTLPMLTSTPICGPSIGR